MTTPRYLLVDPDTPMFYHLVSRCVRRAWLCGYDPATRKDYSYRKQWILDRLEQLTRAFAVDVFAYAIMSNHFHLVVHYDPKACEFWSEAEVVQRWLMACPPKKRDGTVNEELRALMREALLSDKLRIERMREALGSMSFFMKLLKQPIARRANLEDGCTGHVFEQRYYSGALLDESAVIATMAYVDLNPIRAQIADSIVAANFTSAQTRWVKISDPDDLMQYLAPVMGDLNTKVKVAITLRDYIARVSALLPGTQTTTNSTLNKWRDQVATLKRRQRAYGGVNELVKWIGARGLQMREQPLPQIL